MTDSGKILLLFLAVVVRFASAECPYDFTAIGRSCYRLSFGPYTFNEALETCANYSGYLAEFSDHAKYVPFLDYVESNSADASYWIGGTDGFTWNDWRWIKTGIKVESIPTLVDWCAGHPLIDSEGDNLTVLLFSPIYETHEIYGNFCWMDADPKMNNYMGNDIGFVCEATPLSYS